MNFSDILSAVPISFSIELIKIFFNGLFENFGILVSVLIFSKISGWKIRLKKQRKKKSKKSKKNKK